ncbi:MAG: DinB family protein [Ignavibacteriae bacterium]|nr:DinB family protein [Ignavibacteriota bacterium]MCB9244731.1 DinB family protein [Ignavibacteriales bacterium]
MENPVAKHLMMQWEWMLNWVNGPLGSLSDEDLLNTITESGNSGIWILGHLVISDDDFSLYMGKGDFIYPGYREYFASGSVQRPVNDYPPVKELREAWINVCEKNRTIYLSLTDEELEQPHARINVEGEDFVKTKAEVAGVWQFHQVYHAGQLGVLLSKIRKQKSL